MAGVAVRVLAGEVLARLKAMEGRGSNLTGVMAAFGGYMKGSIERNFAAGGRPAWPPLKLATITAWSYSRKTWHHKKTGRLTEAGARALSGRLPLTDTGRLRRSIFYIPSARGVQIATNVKYAAIHQFGGTIPPIRPKRKKALFWPTAPYPVRGTSGGKIPPRPFLVFQDEDIAWFERSLARYLLTGAL